MKSILIRKLFSLLFRIYTIVEGYEKTLDADISRFFFPFFFPFAFCSKASSPFFHIHLRIYLHVLRFNSCPAKGAPQTRSNTCIISLFSQREYYTRSSRYYSPLPYPPLKILLTYVYAISTIIFVFLFFCS